MNYEAQQLDRSGNLGPLIETCITHARKTFLTRFSQDTDPTIVQMILYGTEISHWYYRSKEWIDQPYFIPQQILPPYCGPADIADPNLYGEGTFIVDDMSTRFIRKEATLPK
jgi:hypothetical protein